ncbi:uncharacterized protein PAC_07892 [Phialocephala subalpina]|uniref:Uncharacterized protein n=1 Tax=Phialocephala subalpina TaxID=576137 RepID=A0A1L7WZ14_9HELO|nr:uncharacterized protein PAC_07892 [Phialocephala subalpina]
MAKHQARTQRRQAFSDALHVELTVDSDGKVNTWTNEDLKPTPPEKQTWSWYNYLLFYFGGGFGNWTLGSVCLFFLLHVPHFHGDERVVGDAPSSSGDARSTFCHEAHDVYTSFLSYILRANTICSVGSFFLTLSRLYPSTNRPRTTPSSPSSSPLPQSSSPHASAPFTTSATLYSAARLLDNLLRAIFGHSYTKFPNQIPLSLGITSRVLLYFFLIWLSSLTLCSLRPYQLNKFFWAKTFVVTPAVIGLFIFCMVNTKGNLGPLYGSTTSGGAFGWFFMYAINAGMGNNSMCRWPQVIVNPLAVTISATFGILAISAINETWGLELWHFSSQAPSTPVPSQAHSLTDRRNQWDLLNAVMDRYWSPGSRCGVALCAIS